MLLPIDQRLVNGKNCLQRLAKWQAALVQRCLESCAGELLCSRMQAPPACFRLRAVLTIEEVIVKGLISVEPSQIFLLSPASCSGQRAQMLMNERAGFQLAVRLRREGAPLADVFTFLSGLYFRGKIAYARKFQRAPRRVGSIWIITAGRGLQPADTIIRVEDLREYAKVAVDARNPAYREPLERDAQKLASQLKKQDRAVLLGSIATDKYTDILLHAFGERLLFPKEFVGRGDMSRGGLMLRCLDSGHELGYVPVAGAVRHGTRPAKLAKRVLQPGESKALQ